jgi:carbon monoxide dehydrogenase subunit G
MHFEGKYDFRTSRQKLWDFLIDPARIAKCLPDLKSFQVESEDKFVSIVRVGIGFVRSDFKFKVEMTGKEPPNRMQLRAVGSGSGSNILLDMTIELSETPTGSELSYSSEAKVVGVMAGLAQRVIKEAADRTIAGVFECIKQQVE